MTAVSGNIHAHELRESKEPDANNDSEEQQTPERIEKQSLNLGKLVTWPNNVNEDDVDTRE